MKTNQESETLQPLQYRRMFLCLAVFVMTVQCYTWLVSSSAFNCGNLEFRHHRSISKVGNLTIGGIIQRSWYNMLERTSYKYMYTLSVCDTIPVIALQYHMVFIYAIHQINRNHELLPNLTLGYMVFESCGNIINAIHGTLSILSGQPGSVPNYSCQKQRSVVGIIGDLTSTTTKAMAQLLGLYKYPQVSFGAIYPAYNDKMKFQSLYQTIPYKHSFFAGITKLLRYFSWTWVGIVATEDDSGEHALQELKKAVAQGGSCVEFQYILPTDLTSNLDIKLSMALRTINETTSDVVILYNSGVPIQYYFSYYDEWHYLPHKVWITSLGLALPFDEGMYVLNGSFQFSIKMREINGLQDFLSDITESKFPSNALLASVLEAMFKCSNRTYHLQYTEESNAPMPLCDNDTVKSLGFHLSKLSKAKFAYSVYTAVYALAHALHDMLSSDDWNGNGGAPWNVTQALKPWELNRFLQKTHFKTPDGDEIVFDDSGTVNEKYDIINWVIFENKSVIGPVVGSFDPSAPEGEQLVINQSAILWHSTGPDTQQIPRSVCSESCVPGYRKVRIESKPSCCFHCAPCPEGEFSNRTDMDSCLKCPDSHWPNARKDGCILRTIDFLSYSDYLGVCLASTTVVFFVSTAAVLGIFVRYRDTPIVKANNRNLSYMLLVSLMLSFLCSLLFIGHPGTLTCLFQQAAFGVIFTIAVSCILTKTITVVIAFNATKPGSKLNRLLGSKAAGSMVLLCTLGEVVICLSWQLTSPPYPDIDIVSETGKMILQCNQGSVTAFYVMIGYMGGLAFASFIVAFLAKNLPDRFNEAQLITFSMLVFCSVWVSFIPAYLSAKGRYMVAVEVFAILASSAGLLGCIFIPKCYIILLKPDLNKREHAMVKVN